MSMVGTPEYQLAKFLDSIKPYITDGVQTFHHQTFNHTSLNHDRVRDETLNHLWVRVIDSSQLAMSSCYKVYIIKCLVINVRD